MRNESDNPVLSKSILDKIASAETTSSATLGGTAMKVAILLAVTIFSGYFGWQATINLGGSANILILGSVILGFAFAVMASFKPRMAHIFGVLYALCQGYFLGAISQIFDAQFSGIVLQAVGLSGAIFASSLWLFSTGKIKVSQRFRTGVILATLGIGLYYLVAFGMSLFGLTPPLIFDSGPVGIAFSLIVVGLATLNLILDYDLIQRFISSKSPKFFEWYAAFALVVTLLWLYFEVLRLLSKMRE